ncbi:MAG: glycosyltransferase family 39 protein [Cyanobacteria bacterium]|nr:glycosyltransferase family 39 protein [Cyanobacteria bacterium CG_2015-16_32_12]NCO77860.1 glycosyltransferase family 39 protein [Cyanobacteria bacterium CG_2015-22_32_23]NCQ40430.1 glycosyltransferase family 39 protein [Cyanobacteria bacterium CG_2015-04_32_10]NCS84709.1 glycosyltransferase family 39 protein [Cyanobacteria bacterium CG_2015-02_32_10]
MNRHLFTSDISKYRVKSQERWLEFFSFFSLFIAAIILYSFHLGDLPLRDWDEGTFAQVAKEIYQSSFSDLHWLFPTIWNEPYFNKPPLIHSLTALVYSFGGINEFTTRIVGASLTALSVPLLYSLTRELFLPRYYGIFSALVYLTTMPVVRHGRLAMLDGGVLCFQILLMLCILKARRDLRWCLPAGLSFALICLSKGWLMGILFIAITFLFLFWDTPRLVSSVYLWIGLLLGAFPVVAWQWAQYQYYGENFINTSIKNQSVNRVFTAVEGHQGPIWYYLLELLKYPHPWLFISITGLAIAWGKRNWSWAKFIIVWSSAYLLAISIMGTKLPWYIMPIYPVLSIAAGVALGKIKSLPSFKSYPPLWKEFFLLLSIAITGGFFYFLLTQPYNQNLLTVLGLLLITFSVTTILLFKKDQQFIPVLFWGMYVSLMVFFSSDYWLWELNEAYPVKPVAAIVKKEVKFKENVYISFDYERPSMNFYSEHQVIPANLEEMQNLIKSSFYLLVNPETLSQLNLIEKNNHYCYLEENSSKLSHCFENIFIPESQFILLKPMQ